MCSVSLLMELDTAGSECDGKHGSVLKCLAALLAVF